MARHLVVLLSLALLVALALEDRGLYTLDEGSLLSISSRISHGEVLYRDVCTAIFPGIYYLQAAAFRAFGPSLLLERRMAVAIFLATTACLYLLGRRFTTPPGAFAGALLFVLIRPVLHPIHTVLNYSQASFLMASLALLCALSGGGRAPALRRSRATAPAAGALCAGAGLFKQNYGLFVVLVICGVLATADVPWRARLRHLVLFLAAGAAAAAPLLLYLAAHGAWPELWRNCVRGTVGIVPGAYVVPWAPLQPVAALARAPRMYLPAPVADLLLDWTQKKLQAKVPFVVPFAIKVAYVAPLVVAALALWAAARRRVEGPRALAAVTGLGLLLYAGIFPRTDFAHLTAAAPLTCLALPGALALLPARARRAATVAAVALGAVLGGSMLLLVRQGFDTRLQTARGTVFVAPGDARRVSHALAAIERHVPPGSPLFIAPVDSMYYFLTDHANPTRFDYLEPVNMGRAQARETADRLERSGAPFILYSDRDLEESHVPPLSAYAPELHDYLLSRYEPLGAEIEPFDEVYLCRRRPPPAPPLVDSLALAPVVTVGPAHGERSPAPPQAARPVELLAGRALELLPVADPSQVVRVSWRLALPAGRPSLQLSLVRRTSTWWLGAGPGVSVSARVLDDGKARPLFDVYVDPGAKREHRPALALQADLAPEAGRQVEIQIDASSPVQAEYEVAPVALWQPRIAAAP